MHRAGLTAILIGWLVAVDAAGMTYLAGVLNQREEAPFGDIDESWLHGWMFETSDENRAELDAIVDSGAIMGRNMFGQVCGEWTATGAAGGA
jgi:hypothetical protein